MVEELPHVLDALRSGKGTENAKSK